MSIPVLQADVAMLMHPGSSLKKASPSLSLCLMSSERVRCSENRLHNCLKTLESGKSHYGQIFWTIGNWAQTLQFIISLMCLSIFAFFSVQAMMWCTDTRVAVVWIIRIQLEYQSSFVVWIKCTLHADTDILSTRVCVCERDCVCVCLSCATVHGGGISRADSAVFAGLTYACSWETLRWGQHLLTDWVMWSASEGKRVEETMGVCHSCLLHVWPSCLLVYVLELFNTDVDALCFCFLTVRDDGAAAPSFWESGYCYGRQP